MMTSRAAAGAASAAADHFVLVLKKIQGSVWSEAGRTPLCPTVAWLSERFGVGQYELRLQHGPRVLCICKADAARAQPAPAAQVRLAPDAAQRRSSSGLPSHQEQRRDSDDATWLRAGNAPPPARTALRGTVLG
jgi:hypothetical protein